MSLVSDALLAATGVISPDVPEPEHLRAASEIPPEFARRMRDLVDRNEQMAFRPRLPKRTFDHYFRSLEGEVSPDQISMILEGMQDEGLAAEYLEQLVLARKLLTDAAPASNYTTLTGPVQVDLNEYDRSEWWSVINIAEDPLYIATELEQCTLSLEQVALLTSVYPDLYATMTQILNGALADKITKQAKFQLHPVLEQTLRVFLGMPADDGMMGEQTPPAQPPQAPPAADKTIKLDRLFSGQARTESRR